jgi:hypothetical protein
MTDRPGARGAAAALLLVAGTWSVAGHAVQLLVDSPIVYGSLASAKPFSVPGAGTVTVTLSDLGFTAKLASLTFSATTSTAVVTSLPSAGQTSFTVGAAGLYAAVVDAVATPTGSLDLGQYSLVIGFTAAVPLPPAALLMLSGLGCLALLTRAGGLGRNPRVEVVRAG